MFWLELPWFKLWRLASIFCSRQSWVWTKLDLTCNISQHHYNAILIISKWSIVVFFNCDSNTLWGSVNSGWLWNKCFPLNIHIHTLQIMNQRFCLFVVFSVLFCFHFQLKTQNSITLLPISISTVETKYFLYLRGIHSWSPGTGKQLWRALAFKNCG